MTSELLSKIIPPQSSTDPTSPTKDQPEQNQKNRNYTILNLNTEKFIPLKEKQKLMQQEFQQMTQSGSDPLLFSPSFSNYISPQRLVPYNDMLKKNIRSFNLIQKGKKNESEEASEINEKEEKTVFDVEIPLIEINFKFTCDYELIENDMKEFLELFGEINSLDYDMNGNSLKINYKYYFSVIHANYYLNYLFNKNKNKNENGTADTPSKKEKPENATISNGKATINSQENEEKNNQYLSEKQNEDIVKFIKFLTDNYRNEQNQDEKEKSDKKNNNTTTAIQSNNNEKKYNSNDNLNTKYLYLQQNSETPLKKTNTINNYSANKADHINNSSNVRNNNLKQVGQCHSNTVPLHPFNPSIKTPIVYVPFVPKMNFSNFGIPLSVPVLFPMNSLFFNKPSNQANSTTKKNNTTNNIPDESKDEKGENKINSCLMNNPINIDNNNNEKKNENAQLQNDNKIKEFFEKMNNKIAIISNNSNNSTNSNEKMKNNEVVESSENHIENECNGSNESNGSNNKTDSDIGSNNKILSNKTNSTIKTDEVNKSHKSKSEQSKSPSDEKKNNLKKNKETNNVNNKGSNEKTSSDKSNSFKFDVESSFNGKTMSLEKLNNFLQNSKPVKNFSNPIIRLNSDQKSESNTDQNNNDASNKDNDNINNNIIKDSNNNTPMNNLPKIPDAKNNKNNFYQMAMNNYINSMFNFLYFSNFNQDKTKQIQKNLKPQLINPNIYNVKPNPINFNKNVIDFSKLTLDTKNKVHFMTHSSRNYYYKYVCNYTIQIENDNIFMVTKRIIGKNGCFLKKILQESCIKYGDYSTKIRLRGKGSGYIDKVNNSENSDEPLILSVSSLNYPTYYNCCLLVDSLMNKIYDDYYDHLHMVLPKELHYSIHKKKLVKNEFIVDRVNSMFSLNENKINTTFSNNINEKKENNTNIKTNNTNNLKENEDKKVVDDNGCCENKDNK